MDVAIYLDKIEDGPKGDIRAVDKQLTIGLRLEEALKTPVDVVVLNRASIDMRQNVLVHGYADIIAAYVHANLQRLDDIRDYVEQLTPYLKNQGVL